MSSERTTSLKDVLLIFAIIFILGTTFLAKKRKNKIFLIKTCQAAYCACVTQALLHQQSAVCSVSAYDVCFRKKRAELFSGFRIAFNNRRIHIKAAHFRCKIMTDFVAADNHCLFHRVNGQADLLKKYRGVIGCNEHGNNVIFFNYGITERNKNLVFTFNGTGESSRFKSRE